MHTKRRVRSLAALAGALSGAVATGVSTAAAATRPNVTVARTAARLSRGPGSSIAAIDDDASSIRGVRTISDGTYEVARSVSGTGDERRVVFTAIDLRTGRSVTLN